ncbi:MAG: hypothetical protein ABI986_14830 [Chloroflexota bacterium]
MANSYDEGIPFVRWFVSTWLPQRAKESVLGVVHVNFAEVYWLT